MQILPNKSVLEQQYNSYKPTLETVLAAVEQQLKDSISLSSRPTFKTRIKDFNSYYRKLLRIKPASLGTGDLPVLTDLMGIRVICAFLEDLTLVEQQIVQVFDVREIERKGADLTFKEFGYESVHVLVAIPAEIADAAAVNGFPLPDGCVCEIQIRTILQDAWAEVEHELVYKSEFSPFDLPLKRKLASMNASLSLADIVFQEIRDYQNKLNREIDCRRSSFYEKADKITRENVPDYMPGAQNTAPPPSPYVRGTIDDLLLEAIHAHNTGELDKAVDIYTRIIKSKPEPNKIILSVIFKHRGMAFFAQSKYEEALRDFTASVEYQPDNFRSLYYIGIVYGILGEYEKAVDFFTQSLAINEFQSHVYYRRALAKYHLSDYAAAMADVDTANKLGLDDDDCRRLHVMLMEKFDMNM